jgi:hypothetical protein
MQAVETLKSRPNLTFADINVACGTGQRGCGLFCGPAIRARPALLLRDARASDAIHSHAERRGVFMTRWRTAFVTLAMLAITLPASAASVGLSGGNDDPIPITDSTWQLLVEVECLTIQPLPSTYRCARYDASAFTEIQQIDFRLRDGNGDLIPYPDGITLDGASSLVVLEESTLFPDGYTFKLRLDPDFLQCNTCVFFSSHEGGFEDPRWVQIAGVNGVANENEDEVQFIPEPATLLLLGPGAVLALRRRARRRA